ncbi:MAG: ABC transporter permease [Pseudomonadota bacterium]
MNYIRATFIPILTITAVLIVVWYCASVWLNSKFEFDTAERRDIEISWTQVIPATMAQKRPVLPPPHQIGAEMYDTIIDRKITSKRSLVYHGWITLSVTLLGFAMGTILGVLLAIGIVHSRVLDMSLLPWIITSQTIPILALAPMLIVVMNAVGVTGLIPKAMIATYLSFFPVAVGMVKGLRSPEAMQMDLMHTYSASRMQTLWKLRLPASVPYLFASMKVGVAASLVGAIVAEMPTGAVAGLGARLLAGSYRGQTVQIWSALFTAAIMAAILVALVGLIGTWLNRRMGQREAELA